MALQLTDIRICIEQKCLLQSFNLTVNPGEIFTIMGPSGCGKSTLLSYIAGALMAPASGQGDVVLNGVSLTSLPIELRRVGILFQDPLLFPHMTVYENLIFACPHESGQTREDRVKMALRDIGLPDRAHSYPKTLSGGQSARVSLMRTLIAQPGVLLLDEPFSKLDSDTRALFRQQVYKLVREQNIPAIVVTHDKEDISDPRYVVHFASQTQTL